MYHRNEIQMSRQTEPTVIDASRTGAGGTKSIPRRSALRALGLVGVALGGSGLGLASMATAAETQPGTDFAAQRNRPRLRSSDVDIQVPGRG